MLTSSCRYKSQRGVMYENYLFLKLRLKKHTTFPYVYDLICIQMECACWNHPGFVLLRVSSNCKGSYWILTLASKGQVLGPTCEWTVFRKRRGGNPSAPETHSHTSRWSLGNSGIPCVQFQHESIRQLKERPIRPCRPPT